MNVNVNVKCNYKEKLIVHLKLITEFIRLVNNKINYPFTNYYLSRFIFKRF